MFKHFEKYGNMAPSFFSPLLSWLGLQVADGSKEGRASRLSLWSHPGNDVTGMIARSQKVDGTCQEVMVILVLDLFFYKRLSILVLYCKYMTNLANLINYTAYNMTKCQVNAVHHSEMFCSSWEETRFIIITLN